MPEYSAYYLPGPDCIRPCDRIRQDAQIERMIARTFAKAALEAAFPETAKPFTPKTQITEVGSYLKQIGEYFVVRMEYSYMYYYPRHKRATKVEVLRPILFKPGVRVEELIRQLTG